MHLKLQIFQHWAIWKLLYKTLCSKKKNIFKNKVICSWKNQNKNNYQQQRPTQTFQTEIKSCLFYCSGFTHDTISDLDQKNKKKTKQNKTKNNPSPPPKKNPTQLTIGETESWTSTVFYFVHVLLPNIMEFGI